MSAFGGKEDPRRPFPECLLMTLTGTPALQSHSLEASSGETTLGEPRRPRCSRHQMHTRKEHLRAKPGF